MTSQERVRLAGERIVAAMVKHLVARRGEPRSNAGRGRGTRCVACPAGDREARRVAQKTAHRACEADDNSFAIVTFTQERFAPAEVVARPGARWDMRAKLRGRPSLDEQGLIHRGVETVCGRITQDLNLKTLFAMYGLPPEAPALNLASRYNGCPTQEFVVCRPGRDGRTLARLRWGLVPMWAKDLKIGARMINARSETVHEKPAFRSAFRRRRCVIPVNGWFEWRREGGAKQPYWIRPENAETFSLAGLWERWDKGEEPVETFTILTTAASTALADIHHRQPVIVGDGEVDGWLDPASPSERLVAMARAAFAGPFDRRRVSRAVNNARNDAPELIRPAEG